MGRRREQEGGKNISVSLYEKQLRMTQALIDRGLYDKVSEIVRHGIEKVYNEQIGEVLIDSLEEYGHINSTRADALRCLLESYEDRKNSMSVKGQSKYEHYSKSWIVGNAKIVESVFPDMSVDEIYLELESMIKRDEDDGTE
jgi:Arc/MetJ-type ribon-helix-helix transcriptional regulator